MRLRPIRCGSARWRRHSRDNLDIGRIGAITLAENVASINLLQKLGLERQRAVKIGDEMLQLYMWCQ